MGCTSNAPHTPQQPHTHRDTMATSLTGLHWNWYHSLCHHKQRALATTHTQHHTQRQTPHTLTSLTTGHHWNTEPTTHLLHRTTNTHHTHLQPIVPILAQHIPTLRTHHCNTKPRCTTNKNHMRLEFPPSSTADAMVRCPQPVRHRPAVRIPPDHLRSAQVCREGPPSTNSASISTFTQTTYLPHTEHKSSNISNNPSNTQRAPTPQPTHCAQSNNNFLSPASQSSITTLANAASAAPSATTLNYTTHSLPTLNTSKSFTPTQPLMDSRSRMTLKRV